jgi:hypothetical protein
VLTNNETREIREKMEIINNMIQTSNEDIQLLNNLLLNFKNKTHTKEMKLMFDQSYNTFLKEKNQLLYSDPSGNNKNLILLNLLQNSKYKNALDMQKRSINISSRNKLLKSLLVDSIKNNIIEKTLD